MTSDVLRHASPPYDPEIAGRMGHGSVDGHSLAPEDIPRLRALNDTWRPTEEELSRGGRVGVQRREVPGLPGQPDIPVMILRPLPSGSAPQPVLLACHGGGLVAGTIYSGSTGLAGWVEQLGLVSVLLDYRLAPEHPYPAALDDVATVLAWLHAEAETLALDTTRLGLFGISAGATLAVAANLRCRDHGLPGSTFQILQDPMLDDRLTLPSTYEHIDEGVWDRGSATTAWNAWLGGRRGDDDIPLWASPGRGADDPSLLAGLPPTFIDVGSADLFRDEAVAFAAALTTAGVSTEFHLWPGGWHGFSEMAADAALARRANATRSRYLADRIAR